MRAIQMVAVLLACMVWSVGARAADTLVVKGADGKIKPAAAKSWKSVGDTVVFTLAAGADGADGAAWAQALGERLAGAKVSLDKGQLRITGIPESTLLDQLSTLSLGGEADPLAELAGLGGGVAAMDTPEGGGSIRASKPTAMSIKKHDPRERFEAEVLEVRHGKFPNVVLKLKLRKGAKAGALRKKLRSGKVIEVAVVYNTGGSGADLSDKGNRQNLVAWYLKRGDRVYVHPILAKNTYVVDWIARK